MLPTLFRNVSTRLLSILTATVLVLFSFAFIDVHAASANLMPNPLLETVNSSNPSTPVDWQTGTWGTNTTAFTYLKTGSSGDNNSVQVKTTAYSSGASEWYSNPVNITANQQYTYSDYYQSTSTTEVDAAFTLANGTTQYQYLGSPGPSSTWQNFATSFTAPASTVSVSIYHLIYSVGTLTTDNFSLTPITAPTVSITTPGPSTTVSGSAVPLTASASDASGISSVQFQVNGSNVGSPVTLSPYTYDWNTTSVVNGSYSLTAIATNAHGITTTSSPVQITVDNPSVATSNILPNSLLETDNPANTAEPLDWTGGTWGTNTTNFSYLNSGTAGDSNSVEAQITSYTSGSSEWIPNPVPIKQDQQYEFADNYKTNVPSEVDASFYMSNGSIDYQILGFPTPSTTWNKFETTFSVPAGAQSVSIYQYIDNVGYVITNNYSITPYTPTGFSSPLVSLTFDDGYSDTYTNGLPLLTQYGMTSTQYIITDVIGDSGYMSAAQIQKFYSAGDEIASHTVTHDDLTSETSTQVQNELSQSQSTLQSIIGVPVQSFAYPYGYYNSAVSGAAKSYYTSARGVEDGLNSVDNFNPYDLKVQDIYNTTTAVQVADWVALSPSH